MPPTPPTTPPTMGPIGVDDPPLAGAEVEVDTGDVVAAPSPSIELLDVVDVESAEEELVVEAEGVIVSGEKERPSLSPL